MNYKDLPMDVRLERIGELLAKAVYLCVKKEREEAATRLASAQKEENQKVGE